MILSLSTIFVFDFGTVPIVWYFMFFIIHVLSVLDIHTITYWASCSSTNIHAKIK
jgi:hypothetical protein